MARLLSGAEVPDVLATRRVLTNRDVPAGQQIPYPPCPICNDDFEPQMLDIAVDCQSAPSLREKVTGAQVLVLDRHFSRAFQSRAPPFA